MTHHEVQYLGIPLVLMASSWEAGCSLHVAFADLFSSSAVIDAFSM